MMRPVAAQSSTSGPKSKPTSRLRTVVCLAILAALAVCNLVMFDLGPLWTERARLLAETAALQGAADSHEEAAPPHLGGLRAQLASLETALATTRDRLTPGAARRAAKLLALSELAGRHGLTIQGSEGGASVADCWAAVGYATHSLRLSGGWFAWQAFVEDLCQLEGGAFVLSFSLERRRDGLDITCDLAL